MDSRDHREEDRSFLLGSEWWDRLVVVSTSMIGAIREQHSCGNRRSIDEASSKKNPSIGDIERSFRSTHCIVEQSNRFDDQTKSILRKQFEMDRSWGLEDRWSMFSDDVHRGKFDRTSLKQTMQTNEKNFIDGRYSIRDERHICFRWILKASMLIKTRLSASLIDRRSTFNLSTTIFKSILGN